jgi:16S rRNA (guanine527-N7)-methyltransferase
MGSDSRQLHGLLERGLEPFGIDSLSIDRWARLALFIDRWGRRLNLTGHPDVLAIAERLLLEAAALNQALPDALSIADLGSGAGIPGLPIALCRPETQVWLIEARERRHHFQRAAIRELGLENAEALRGRAEDLEPRLCEGVVSQAFAKPERAVAWMRPWMTATGWIALATVPDFPGLSHPDLASGELRFYASPGGPARAVWLARSRAPAENSP